MFHWGDAVPLFQEESERRVAEVEDAALKREQELLRAFAEKVKQSKREREDMEAHVAYVKAQLTEMLDKQDEEYTGEMHKLREELEASKHKDIQLRVDAKGKRLELEVRRNGLCVPRPRQLAQTQTEG